MRLRLRAGRVDVWQGTYNASMRYETLAYSSSTGCHVGLLWSLTTLSHQTNSSCIKANALCRCEDILASCSFYLLLFNIFPFLSKYCINATWPRRNRIYIAAVSFRLLNAHPNVPVLGLVVNHLRRLWLIPLACVFLVQESIMHYIFIPLLAFFIRVAQTIPFSDSFSSFSENNNLLNLINTDSISSTTNPYSVSQNTEYTSTDSQSFIQPIGLSTDIEWNLSGSRLAAAGLDSDPLATTDSESSPFVDSAFHMAQVATLDWSKVVWDYTYLVGRGALICPKVPNSVPFLCCSDGFTTCVPCKPFVRMSSLASN